MTEATGKIVEAHYEVVHLSFEQWIPRHGTRANDPHYADFARVRRQLKAAGKLVCWRCGATRNIQLHHALVEWCAANAVDYRKFYRRYPELMAACTEEAMLAAIESAGGLLALCQPCHTGKGTGIHYIPEPIWNLGGLELDGLPAPAAPIAIVHAVRGQLAAPTVSAITEHAA